MGSGNFDGGGSVKWTVNHTDGDSGKGDKGGGYGRDKDPKGADATFAVFANERLKFTLPATRGNHVKVVWGPESSGPSLTPTAAGPKKKKGSRTAKKAKGRR